jgi:hypothetical protein
MRILEFLLPAVLILKSGICINKGNTCHLKCTTKFAVFFGYLHIQYDFCFILFDTSGLLRKEL